MIRRAALALWVALGLPAAAQPVVIDDYAALKRELDGIITFDTLPRRAEPGVNFDQNIYLPGAWLGERFAGQTLTRGADGHDALTGPALAVPPLAVLNGAPGRNLSLAFHWGFGSNALFPLGPDGFDLITGRGEGSVAVLFDIDQSALGLRLHTHYPAPLGGAPPLGGLEVIFLARDGQPIAWLRHDLSPGRVDIGWRRAGGRPDIAGILVLNTDPGGVAIDDIIFQRTPPLG